MAAILPSCLERRKIKLIKKEKERFKKETKQKERKGKKENERKGKERKGEIARENVANFAVPCLRQVLTMEHGPSFSAVQAAWMHLGHI